MEATIKLSVIIVNYNVRHFLQQCLNSVLAASANLSTEIIVIDNSSPDNPVDMMQQHFPDVIFIRNEINAGFSKANNQGINIAKGEYILLLNPDTVVEEDAFTKAVTFMEKHEDCGGLGVYMIDGKGHFLPESKRGLPTPAVAFYKIFGFAALFPKSKVFGHYHLGYLDKNKTNPVDVLSGACMFLRKEALDKSGLLDEDYFMYGEDIDLSYRITLAGYRNYYLPDTKIIHYKGESTKKSTVNYVFVFYKAMSIFAAKHFAPGKAALFSFMINLAVWFRATLALISRLIVRIGLPLFDAVIIFTGVWFLKNYWQSTVRDVHYPHLFMQLVVPGYILLWIIGAFLGGGYDKPVRISNLIRGILSGTIVILIIYALLPESFRFSRALILLGTAWAVGAVSLTRLLLSATGGQAFKLAGRKRKKLLIVGDEDECQRLLSMLMLHSAEINFTGFLSDVIKDQGVLQSYHLGNVASFHEIIRIYDIDEVIFSSKNLTNKTIVSLMSTNKADVEFKIAPDHADFIIGSNSIHDQGEFYRFNNHDANAINRRNKRIFDLLTSFILLIGSPLFYPLSRKKNYFTACFTVLSGKKNWVGTGSDRKQYIFHPALLSDADPITAKKLGALYNREYKVANDVKVVIKGLFS